MIGGEIARPRLSLPMRHAISALVGALVLGGVAACASNVGAYEEPDLPADRVATLDLSTVVPFDRFSPTRISVVRIDGKPIDRRWSWLALHMDRQEKLNPGRHETVVEYWRHPIFGGEQILRATLYIDVKAGRSYGIRQARAGELVRIWVEDRTTRDVVGMTTIIPESGSR